MYTSFYDELEKIAEEVEAPKKSKLKRNLAIGGGLAAAALVGAGAVRYGRSRSAAKAATKAGKAAEPGKRKAVVGLLGSKKAPPPPDSPTTGLSESQKKLANMSKLYKRYKDVGGPKARGKGPLWKKLSDAATDYFGKKDNIFAKRVLKQHHIDHESFKQADIKRGGKL